MQINKEKIKTKIYTDDLEESESDSDSHDETESNIDNDKYEKWFFERI